MRVGRFLVLVTVLAWLTVAPGCLFRTRKVEVHRSTAKLLNASLDELIERINAEANKVESLNATVNIDTSVGGEKKGKITEYQQISGYVLLRRPKMIRMIGLFPLVRNKAFDMVSDGSEFRVWIPVRNKFYVGHNDVVRPGATGLENLRPQAVYDALLLHRIEPGSDIAVLETSNETVVDKKTRQLVQQPTYVVDVLRKDKDGKYYLHRKVIFDRSDLIPDTQIFYDKQGDVATEARYQVFQDFNGIRFPTVVQIKRPQEEYEIQLTVVKVELNQPLKDDQFALEQPPGSQLVDLDRQPMNAAVPASATSAEAQSSHH
jgi:outer membrane lipoprotein-sorting protein